VVLVPGFADPAALWTPLMARLDGFTLLAVDRPCFGLSGRAAYRTTTIRRLAVDFLEQVLDALALDRPVLVGNSIGSLWTNWMAIDRPDRVAALLHIGCPAFVVGTSAPVALRLPSIRPIGRLVTRLAPPTARNMENFAKRMTGEDFRTMPQVRDMLVAAQRLPGAQAATIDLLHAVIRLRGARPEVAMDEDQLARIRHPVALIWGERDAFGGPSVAARVVAAYPAAELHLVADGGHVPWLGYPDAVAGLAKPFLARHAR
jgi:pimeloyl-ACP methyl ester carboxylesterase